MEFKLDTIAFLQALCCLLPSMSNPIHPEGGRREEGSPGTVAVMSRLVLAHCFGGIYGCEYTCSVCKWCQPMEQCLCLWLHQGQGSGVVGRRQ